MPAAAAVPVIYRELCSYKIFPLEQTRRRGRGQRAASGQPDWNQMSQAFAARTRLSLLPRPVQWPDGRLAG